MPSPSRPATRATRRAMPTAAQKADKIERHGRYKAKLAARKNSQVAAFDAQAQAARKQRLAVFWRKHGNRFQLWWQAHTDPAAAIAVAVVPPPKGRCEELHALLLPELSAAWLVADGGEPKEEERTDGAETTAADWPPAPRGLVWMMRTRAAAASTNSDDASDLAAVGAAFANADHDARRFPGLTEARPRRNLSVPLP